MTLAATHRRSGRAGCSHPYKTYGGPGFAAKIDASSDEVLRREANCEGIVRTTCASFGFITASNSRDVYLSFKEYVGQVGDVIRFTLNTKKGQAWATNVEYLAQMPLMQGTVTYVSTQKPFAFVSCCGRDYHLDTRSATSDLHIGTDVMFTPLSYNHGSLSAVCWNKISLHKCVFGESVDLRYGDMIKSWTGHFPDSVEETNDVVTIYVNKSSKFRDMFKHLEMYAIQTDDFPTDRQDATTLWSDE